MSLLGSSVVAANPVPVPPEWRPVVFEGTILERQTGVMACGRVSIAGWVTMRVDRVENGSLPAGSVVRVVIGCPDMFRAGQRYRVEAVRNGPRFGRWRTYSIQRPIPDRPHPTVWTIQHRPVH